MLIKRIVFSIARMSRKACAILLAVLSFSFLVGLCMVLAAAIILTNGQPNPTWAIPVLASGFVILVIILIAIALTALSSNYVKRNPDKDPKNQ